MTNKLLEKDIIQFINTYPKFKYSERPKMKCSLLTGVVDVCGVNGKYWSSFEIEIYIDKQKYPFCVPIIKEASNRIEREKDWHISEDGICCLDIHHELEYLAKRGINMVSFYQKKIYPFFTNTIYKIKNGKYANEEYKHDFDGVIQFYSEKLKLKDNAVIIKIISSILNNNCPGRNEYCICDKQVKFKKCHWTAVSFLKSLSKERLKKDLIGFQELILNL
jgi:hypothetical protein